MIDDKLYKNDVEDVEFVNAFNKEFGWLYTSDHQKNVKTLEYLHFKD